jgi:hypothetical protein
LRRAPVSFSRHSLQPEKSAAFSLDALQWGLNSILGQRPKDRLQGHQRPGRDRRQSSLVPKGFRKTTVLDSCGTLFPMLSLLASKAEALHFADRTPEALETIKQAEALVEATEARYWSAELYRLRGVFLVCWC